MAANILATPHFTNQGILSASIGANVLATPHFTNQGILSASIGANIIATPHIQAAGILSASVASGQIGRGHVAAAAIASAQIAAGIVGGPLFQDYGLISGKVASGAITEAGLASGISIDIAETAQEPGFRAAEAITANLAIAFTASGYYGHAQALLSGRMPAAGLAPSAITSGSLGTFQTLGRFTNTGWDLSGYIGAPAFVSTSSAIAATPPSASGAFVQRIGIIMAPQSILLIPHPLMVQIGQ